MTWKRVATAGVLIPFVVGIVLWGSTAIVALAVGLVTLLALFEYFALGEAIGHRGYRFWTASCALMLIFVQWYSRIDLAAFRLPRRLMIHRDFDNFYGASPTISDVLFLFVL